MENPDFPSSITRRMEQKLETELSDIERLTRGPRIGIGGGTYLIGNANQKWVARVVKNPPPEMKRMPLVQQRAQSIGVAVPTIIDHSFEQINDEEFMWVIEEYVEGTEFFEVRDPEHLDSESRRAILADLGRQLRRLHAIEIKGFGSLSVDLTRPKISAFGWSRDFDVVYFLPHLGSELWGIGSWGTRHSSPIGDQPRRISPPGDVGPGE